MNVKSEREMSRNIPKEITLTTSENTVPLLTAYGCVLMERDTGKSYIYTAINLKNGRREVIARRPSPLTTKGVDTMLEKIRLSNVAGAGALEADTHSGEQLPLEKCREIMQVVFNEILPLFGFAERKEQISLAFHILEAINRRAVSFAEAEVGTGKSLGYLIPAIIAKRARLNSYWNMSFYTGTPYVEMMDMPVVVATSSIALQKALIAEVIPRLSDILLEAGVIKTPIVAVLRKGREHYLCHQKLLSHIPFVRDEDVQKILAGLLKPNATIDLAEVDGLTAYIKRKISVGDRCSKTCPNRETCAYLRFREQLESSGIDIQVCNHNYLLADTLRRVEGVRPLIPNYQMIIIDEAHKFLGAARSMYGSELSVTTILEVCDMAHTIKFRNETAQGEITQLLKLLADQSCRMFRKLEETAKEENAEDETTRFTASLDNNELRNLRNIHNTAESLITMLLAEHITGNGAGRRNQVLWELRQIVKDAVSLLQQGELITWVEIEGKSGTGGTDCKLCAIPVNLNKRLYDDLWSKGIPTILTSGTLSSGGDFTHIKRALGIDRLAPYKVMETSIQSPFNYKENALIYISENIPFPDQRDNDYIFSVANEIEELIYASHGHAAVLFTSYRAMDKVCDHLSDRGIPFPMFRLERGDIKVIDLFKASGNGILFAAGALWEGIDIPGDALSLVVIVKLPFPVPDPISEYEQTLYASPKEYKEQVMLPETAVKTKQGQGRGHRTENDTAVIAYLDCRLAPDGLYLPYFASEVFPADCAVTHDIDDVTEFYVAKKTAEYFETHKQHTQQAVS